MDEKDILKWKFDISTFRLIGRELITDRITALFELVKNSYDANAQQVNVLFENVEPNKLDSQIIIEDDGIGMSFEDIRDKWMVIGTSNKRKSPYSPEPFLRKCVGEKGIGRFAVDKLGDCLTVITKQKGTASWLKVNIDWSAYSVNDNGKVNKWFTDIESPYEYIPTEETEAHGTKLIIKQIREPWDSGSIKHAITQMSKLVSPFTTLTYPFSIYVSASEYGIRERATKSLDDFDMATYSFNIEYDSTEKKQEYAEYNKEKHAIEIRKCDVLSFGGVKMKVYFFDAAARRKYKNAYPNDSIDGFKIYRDGIIATPFAEEQENPDAKRDILGIDKRLWQDIFSRISSREFIGVIEITKKDNPRIIDATNRQDFVENSEYKALKRFIIEQLIALQMYKDDVRKKEKETNKTQLAGAEEELAKLTLSLKSLARKSPEIGKPLEQLIKQTQSTRQVIKTAIQKQKKESEEFLRKENAYLSIMSMQEYSIQIAHAIRTTLNQLKGRIEFFKDFYPLPQKESIFKQYAKEMFDKLKILNKVTDYMLSYSQANINPEPVDMCKTFEDIFATYDDLFEENNIILQKCFPEKVVLNTNKRFFYDIMQNMVDNSIKALGGVKGTKYIKCSYQFKDDHLQILMTDNGCGIPQKDWIKVFELYYTTTEMQGGGGVGLYIVKTRVESLKGTVAVVPSEFGSVGTTIEINIPFKN